MATEVYTATDIELQDGTTITVKPLTIKRLRRFMEVIQKFEKVDDEAQSIDLMVDACAIAIEQSKPELAENRDALEDVLDVPTMWKILEVAGGIKMDDPNLIAAAMAGTS